MEKEAQRKSILKGLGRALNPMEHVRYYGSSAYREIYDAVTSVDNQMREAVTSQKQDIKNYLHEARMSLKNRDYAKVMYYAWKVIGILDGIFGNVGSLSKTRDRVITEHYKSGLSQEELADMNKQLGGSQTPLKNTPVQMPTNAEFEALLYATGAPEAGLVSFAGPAQWFQENIPTFRQMESSLLERLFKNQMGKQRESAVAALRLAEKSYESVKDMFRKLDSARTDPNKYIKIAEKYQKFFSDQNAQLRVMYAANFRDTVNRLMSEKAAPSTTDNTESAPKPATTQPAAPSAPSSPPPANIGNPVSQPSTQVSEQEPLGTDDSDWWKEQRAAAAIVVHLIKRAEQAAAAGDKGIASALLVKASEICDDNGATVQSISLMEAAEIVLKG